MIALRSTDLGDFVIAFFTHNFLPHSTPIILHDDNDLPIVFPLHSLFCQVIACATPIVRWLFAARSCLPPRGFYFTVSTALDIDYRQTFSLIIHSHSFSAAPRPAISERRATPVAALACLRQMPWPASVVVLFFAHALMRPFSVNGPKLKPNFCATFKANQARRVVFRLQGETIFRQAVFVRSSSRWR